MKTTLPWLLKREYWENRGGFFWAPAIGAGITLLLTVMGLITAEVFRSRFTGDIQIGIPLRRLTEKLSEEDLSTLGGVLDMALLSMSGLLQFILFFVVFFYLLGALYDDRRDRSVLFWKSLPLSDSSMVVSKVLAAAVVAPVLSTLIAMALQFALLILLSIYVLFHGINPLTVLWGPNSMVPQPKDAVDLYQHMKYFMGMGPRPKFDRYTYWEKFDYMAVFWGMFIIGGSGLLLWFFEELSGILPGWAFNVATLVHGHEALLAIGFIFTIHFFNGHLRAEKFPMDTVIFTGTMSEHEFKDERPLEYERMQQMGQLKSLEAQAPSAGKMMLAWVVGGTGLILGLLTIVLMIYSLLSH